jgi:hypothetical protein
VSRREKRKEDGEDRLLRAADEEKKVSATLSTSLVVQRVLHTLLLPQSFSIPFSPTSSRLPFHSSPAACSVFGQHLSVTHYQPCAPSYEANSDSQLLNGGFDVGAVRWRGIGRSVLARGGSALRLLGWGLVAHLLVIEGESEAGERESCSSSSDLFLCCSPSLCCVCELFPRSVDCLATT